MAKPETKSNMFLRALPGGGEVRRAGRAPETLGAYPQLRMRRNRTDAWTGVWWRRCGSRSTT